MSLLPLLVTTFLVIAAPYLLGCKTSVSSTSEATLSDAVLKKIHVDISQVSADGLVGPPDGRRSLSYELCIPANQKALAEVQAIDPTIQHSRSRGRIGCTTDQYLVIGSTHTPEWRQILMAIAGLPYVQRIEPFWGE